MKNLISAFILIYSAFFAVNAQQTVTINFQAFVGDKPFDCRETYEGIGTTSSKMSVTDFKFYVQDVRLIDKKGKEISVNLVNDGKFQTEKVALLDFENGEGTCTNGTKELNTSIRGTVPKGKYSGVKFIIGVPEELNHLDPTLQPSPLNNTRMMWSWLLGFKFARIDTRTTGRPNGYVLHLGSVNCTKDEAGNIACARPNRPEFSFEKFDLEKNSIVVDLKSLFAGANLDFNQEKTAAGCMSFEGDSDCAPVFKNLGLPFDGNPAVKQTFLRAGKTVKQANKTAE